VDVIVTIGTVTTRAAKAATATIPIVMAGSNDPVENGFVTSLAHPGGNVTGLTRYPPGLLGKSLQLFKDVAPDISRLAVLGADFPESGLQEAAGKLKIAVLGHDTADVKSNSEFDAILFQIAEERVDAVFVMSNFTNEKYRDQLFAFLSRNKLPSMFEETYFVETGEGLISYFTSVAELRHRAAFFVDKIFKGIKPSDLPVELPTRFKLVVNLKTAKMLRLTIPHSVLSIADKIIEE
jgi:putative ABC transport system substrate-binding protein